MLYLETAEGFAPWTGAPIAGVLHPPLIEQLWTPGELAAIGLYVPADHGVPEGEREVSRSVQRVNGVPTVVYVTEAIPIAELRATKLEALGERRWQAEVGGMVLNGMPVKTDRETTGILTAAYVTALADPEYSINWKIDTGVFVTLDAATIIAISTAARAHVQACYDREAALTGLILAASNAAELDAIDLEAGWP